jgi:hypothetical protein
VPGQGGSPFRPCSSEGGEQVIVDASMPTGPSAGAVVPADSSAGAVAETMGQHGARFQQDAVPDLDRLYAVALQLTGNQADAEARLRLPDRAGRVTGPRRRRGRRPVDQPPPAHRCPPRSGRPTHRHPGDRTPHRPAVHPHRAQHHPDRRRRSPSNSSPREDLVLAYMSRADPDPLPVLETTR